MGGKGSGRKLKRIPSAPLTDLERLYAIARDRGFARREDLARFLAQKCNYRKRVRAYADKIAKYNFTYADVIMISDALEMTAAEFVATWFPNMFREKDGVLIMRVSDEVREALINHAWNADQIRRRDKEKRMAIEQPKKDAEEFLKNFK